ncbi:MAG TPA: FtsQ-type POTRA domain-containing protein [Gemmatimonadales bacterium]|nr:FtsQ-type POTRA domain-containing protein [Gemmatimonadales bacterium]
MRVKRFAIAVALVIAALSPWWGPVVLRRFAFFEVRRVEVVGARYLAPFQIVEALQLKPGASVWQDLGAMKRRVGLLGGVASVRVSRQLPAALHVEVTEVEPVALAAGPSGLVPVGADGRPLPYDPATAPVDAPVVERATPQLMAALATVQSADPALFGLVAAARSNGGAEGGVVLELDSGRLLVGTPVSPAVVRAMSAVRRDLGSRGRSWQELDGRFQGWVVVRGGAHAAPARLARPAAARRARAKAVALVSERHPRSGATNAAAVSWLSSGAA